MSEKITPEATREALAKSIEHWERLASGTEKDGESIFSEDCALCDLFFANEDCELCEGCPVAQRTGLSGCLGSPWYGVQSEWCKPSGKTTVAFREACKVQLEFLRSLEVKG